MAHEQPIIIIKKKRRGHHDEHHGGAWKVAFADFAIAMMAFFMVLWIMEIASQEEREEIQYQLQNSSVFDNMDNLFDMRNSPFPIDFGGEASPFENPVQSKLNGPDALGPSLHQRLPEGAEAANAGRGRELNSILKGQHLNAVQLEMLAKEVSEMAESLSASSNLVLELVPQGLRILIQDSDKQAMFGRGSAIITPFFEDMLFELAPMLGQIKNRLVISGHTDNTHFKSSTYSNWNLSGDRALAARQFLVDSGLPQQNVLQVVAMADRMLIDEANPRSGENRRIEVMILTPEADKQLAMLFGKGSQPGTAVEQAKKFAESNKPVSRLDVMVK
ncbi:flagellar motor protein MotB [Photobacterium nomapromontoriensis]|uniref:flagellar motor protein MotB n=1 Tax=Photobacterium nomapromontoriensis TaxID=2910237 RepID=UPI003D0CF212